MSFITSKYYSTVTPDTRAPVGIPACDWPSGYVADMIAGRCWMVVADPIIIGDGAESMMAAAEKANAWFSVNGSGVVVPNQFALNGFLGA